MDYKLVLISILVSICVAVDSFSYNQGNGIQATWSANQQIKPNVYQTEYASTPKDTILQNGYNPQWNQGYNVVQNSPLRPSSSAHQNIAGLWNNERASQPLQIVGKPLQSQAYPNSNYAQGYTNYQPGNPVTPSGYNGISQNVLHTITNQYGRKISSSDYIPWPVSETKGPQVLGLNTAAKYSTQPILPVDPVPVSSLNLEYGPAYKDQDTIVPTQSPVFEQPIYDKPYIIIHENGTYENLDNLDNIVWDEHNRAHLTTKEPPNYIIAIIEIEGVKKPENDTVLEVPYDTGITKTPQGPIDTSVPQKYTDAGVQTTTEDPMKYYKPEYLMPIQKIKENSIYNTPYPSQPKPQTNEEQVKINEDSASLYALHGYNIYANQPQFTNSPISLYTPQNNQFTANTPNKNVNYAVPNTITYNSPDTPGTMTSSPFYGGNLSHTQNIQSYGPYPLPNTVTNRPQQAADSGAYNTDTTLSAVTYSPSYGGSIPYSPNIETNKPYPANTDTKTYPVTDSTPNHQTYKPYVSYNSAIYSPSYTVRDTLPETVTDKTSNTVTYSPQQANTDRETLTTSNTPSTVPYVPVHRVYKPSIPNIGNYNQYTAKTDSQTYTVTESTPNTETNEPYVQYNTVTNSPLYAVSDTKPNTVTDRPQQINTDKISDTTESTPYTGTYRPSYAETDSTPSTASNIPHSVTEPLKDIINYNSYNTATNSPIENNTYIFRTTTSADYTTPYQTEATLSQTPTTTSKPDVVQPSSEIDDRSYQYGQQPVDKEEPNNSNQDYDTNYSDTSTSGAPDKQIFPRNGYNGPRYYAQKPNIDNYEYYYGAKIPFNPTSDAYKGNKPRKGFYNRPSYYRPEQNNAYDIKEPSDSTSDFSSSELQNKPQTSDDFNNKYPVTDSSNLQTYPQDTSACPPNEVSNSCIQAICAPLKCSQLNTPIACPSITAGSCKSGCVCQSGFLRNDITGVCVPEDTCLGYDSQNPEHSSIPDGSNNGNGEIGDTIPPSEDANDAKDLQNGYDASDPDYDSNLYTDNDGFNDDSVSGSPYQSQPSNESNNGTGSQNGYNYDENEPYSSPGPYDGYNNELVSQNDDGYKQPTYSNTYDDVENTSSPQSDVSDGGIAPRDENKPSIDYALNLREPPRLRSDLEIDPSELKKNVDKPVVWFRKDQSFWDKVTKGEGAYDSLSVYNINCMPMLIERMTTVHHYANGTNVVEYVDSIWDSPDAPHPREITAKRVFRTDSDE